MVLRHLKCQCWSVILTGIPAASADAGTDCALGEIFSIDLPPGIDSINIEVISKHALTGDEPIGTASLSLEQITESNGEVVRAPVMSKKGMAGELEVTASVSDAPQVSRRDLLNL